MTQVGSPSLSDLFEADLSEGTIRNRLTNSRGFVFASFAWAGIREDFEAVYLSGGPTIMERMGFVFGKGLVKAEWRSNGDQAVFFEKVSKLAGVQAGGKSASLLETPLLTNLGSHSRIVSSAQKSMAKPSQFASSWLE